MKKHEVRRQPTQADVARWQKFADKIAEARKLLTEADTILGLEVIPSLDGDDTTSFDLVKRIGDRLEQVRMACWIEHPVESHWAGGPKDAPYFSLSWRH